MISLQELLIEQEVLTEQKVMDKIKSLLKNGVAAGVIIATLVGGGFSEAKAQELVKKVQTELVDSLDRSKVYSSVEDFHRDVDTDFTAFYSLRFPSESIDVEIAGESFTAYGAVSKDLQTSLKKALPAGKKARIRAFIDLSKHNKSGYLGIVLIPN